MATVHGDCRLRVAVIHGASPGRTVGNQVAVGSTLRKVVAKSQPSSPGISNASKAELIFGSCKEEHKLERRFIVVYLFAF